MSDPATRNSPPVPPRPSALGRVFRNADASLRARVLIPTVILFAVIIALMAYVAVRLHSRDLRRQEDERGLIVARLIRSELANTMLNTGAKNVHLVLSSVAEYRHEVSSISIVRATGQISQSSDTTLIGTRPWGAMDQQGDAATVHDMPAGHSLSVVQPIYNDKECQRCHTETPEGAVTAWLDVRIRRGPTIDWTLARVMTLTAVPMLFLLLGILWWLLSLQVVRPLRRLMGVMGGARSGHRGLIADEGRADELGEVARAFDETYAQLRRAHREIEHFYRERSLQVDRFAAVGELATGLAHEIKNPLAGLSGALELLSEDLKEGFQSEIVAEMQIQLERLTQTMNGMLNFARPSKVVLSPTDVRRCIANVVFLVRQHVRKHGEDITLHVDADTDVPLALADATQLEQALLNIALNAVQAMRDEGGKLTVRTFVDEDRIVVRIADTGPGIPEEVRDRIFEPYFTTKGGGTGLGLALSARIIAEHNGTIEYECPPEGGTIFRVSLRLAAAPSARGIAV